MLQIPCLKAENIDECTENYEFLLYLLKQMHKDMKTIEQLKQEVRDTKLPEEIKEVFYNVLDTADVASLSERDRDRYEANLKFYRDAMWQLRDMKKEGLEEGRKEGREEGRKEKAMEFATFLKSDGHPVEYIVRATGLSISEIEKL